MSVLGIVVDACLVLVGLSVAVGGWRRGALVSVTSLIGLVAGFCLGSALLPLISRWLSDRDLAIADHRILLAGVVLFGSALILQSIGFAVAAAVRRRLFGRSVRRVDSVGGALVGVLTVALLVWLAAGFVRTTALPGANAAVTESRVVAGLDRVAPVSSSRALGAVADTLARSGFPRVFLDRQERIESVDPPDQDIPMAVREASDSVVRVIASGQSCRYGAQGSGWVTSGDRVVTNAHVVAGADQIGVRARDGGPLHPARLIGFDPDSDVAVLHVPGLDVRPLATAGPLQRGEAAFAAGFPGNGPFSFSPARVRQTTTAVGTDIYDTQPVRREIYSLRATIESGDSGGPLFDSDGKVVGMVFARSSTDDDTGYALTLDEIRPTVASSSTSSDKASDSGACLRPVG